ncbi:MAG: ParB/RepB/Spo0J family partition protein [Gemmatimonadota bacterium]
MPKNDSRLGKGLGALLGDVLEAPDEASLPVREVPLERLRANRFQPRRDFDDDAIAELTASIRENGLLQPLVVRRIESGYELVAGERRLRAIRELGWERAPAVLRDLSDEAMLVLALVENLQRENLNPIEEASAFQQLIDGFGFTQMQVAERLGRDRSTVSNTLRLLALPSAVRELVESGTLSAGHARAVLSLDSKSEQVALAREIAAGGLSVREAERRARKARGDGGKGKEKGATTARGTDDPVARRAATLLGRSLGTGVEVRLSGREKGEIRIPFHDADDFERILRQLLREGANELFGDGGS